MMTKLLARGLKSPLTWTACLALLIWAANKTVTPYQDFCGLGAVASGLAIVLVLYVRPAR